jgi:putative oxidoreductase
MRALLHPVARFLMALIFLLSGFNKILHFAPTASMMAQLGLPSPQGLEVGAIAFELVGGLGLLVGYRTRFAAALLFTATLLFTIFVHGKLLQNSQLAEQQLIEILKNIALMGGLLKFGLDGPGSYAVDRLDES